MYKLGRDSIPLLVRPEGYYQLTLSVASKHIIVQTSLRERRNRCMLLLFQVTLLLGSSCRLQIKKPNDAP